jgi:hypothetical protein
METKRFEIVPPGKQVLLVPLLAATAVMAALAFALTSEQRTPLPTVAYLAFAAVPVLAALIALDMFRRDVALTDKGLRVRTLPWSWTIPLDQFELERAEIVDLAARPELMPGMKLIGARLPGYRAGLFRLRDKRRASVLLTDLQRVLLLPRRDGSVLMLSLQQPDALLQALRRRG